MNGAYLGRVGAMGRAWAVAGAFLLLAAVAGPTSCAGESERPDAMVFIRVVADIRVDFGGVKAPIERKGLELATGAASSSLRLDSS